LLWRERVEEVTTDVARVTEDGALRGPAALGGQPNPDAATTGPALGPLHEATVLHARQHVRDAALLPVERLGELADAHLAAGHLPQRHQHAELGLRDAAIVLQIAV